MDSCNSSAAEQGKKPCSLHHHHHHHHHHLYYVSPHCPLHISIIQPHNHSPTCSYFSTSISNTSPQQPPLASNPNLTFFSHPRMQDEVEKPEVAEDDEEPVFVLTDEWREFFAKSEAKRKLAKKQAKKKGKT